MDYLTPAALIWVAIFVLLGLARGFWKALAALLGLAGAYVASAYFTPPLKRFLLRVFESANLGETVTGVVSATIIFVLAGLLIRLVVVLISRSLPVTHRLLDAVGGALFSGVYGAVMALVMVWGTSFIIESYHSQKVADNQEIVTLADSSPPIVAFSRQIMADVIGWNLRQNGASEQAARIAEVYARQPSEVLNTLQNSVRSEEFKGVINSEAVQRMVQEHDSEGLHKSPEFTRLMQQPAVQKLRAMISPKGAEWSDEKVAQQMVDVWGGIEQVKSNPEVKVLIEDPEVQSFLRDGGKVTPSLLAKGQKLLAILATESSAAAPAASQTQREQGKIPALYKWYDDSGELNITEYAEIPLDKQQHAQKISL